MHYSFVLYSFNPEHITEHAVSERLRSLGFAQITKHTRSRVVSWVSDHTIIMTKPSTDIEHGGITGVGFVGNLRDLTDIDQLNEDPDTSMLHVKDQYGNLLFLIAADGSTVDYTRVFYQEVPDIPAYCPPMITECIGLVQDSHSTQHQDFFLTDWGYKASYSTDRYTCLLDKGKHPLILRSDSDSGQFHTMIVNTNNIFEIISKMISMGVELEPVDPATIPRNFGDLTHLVVGYRCVATGDKTSYCIERRAKNVLPGLDWIIQMRSNQIHIKPDQLDAHYGEAI